MQIQQKLLRRQSQMGDGSAWIGDSEKISNARGCGPIIGKQEASPRARKPPSAGAVAAERGIGKLLHGHRLRKFF